MHDDVVLRRQGRRGHTATRHKIHLRLSAAEHTADKHRARFHHHLAAAASCAADPRLAFDRRPVARRHAALLHRLTARKRGVLPGVGRRPSPARAKSSASQPFRARRLRPSAEREQALRVGRRQWRSEDVEAAGAAQPAGDPARRGQRHLARRADASDAQPFELLDARRPGTDIDVDRRSAERLDQPLDRRRGGSLPLSRPKPAPYPPLASREQSSRRSRKPRFCCNQSKPLFSARDDW